MPVAYNCRFVPAARVGGATGVIEPSVPVIVMPVSDFPVTVSAAVFVTVVPLVCVTVAVITALPAATPVTTPVVLTTDAMAGFDEVQTATEVMFPVVPFG